jgi:hypothetical protein
MTFTGWMSNTSTARSSAHPQALPTQQIPSSAGKRNFTFQKPGLQVFKFLQQLIA